MKNAKSLQIKLPLPPSVNAAYSGTGIKGNYSKKRTEDYNNWLELAGTFFRLQFPQGLTPDSMIKGRVRSTYLIVRTNAHGCDISNYVKVAEDYLQGKFYLNDSQIDEIFIKRRIDPAQKRSFLYVFVEEIEDKRMVDMFNPV